MLMKTIEIGPASRLARLPALACVLAGFLLGGPDAAGQTTQVLVSNLGQTMATAGGTEHGVAQAFRTGANTDGYTLTSIDLRLSVATTPTVTLRRGSVAGSEVASFTAPSTTTGISFANITFTPTTTVTLEPNTDYWVVAAGGSSRWTWSVTGPDEDATTASGWSIADRGQSYNPNSGSWEDNGGDLAWQISVKGVIISGGGVIIFPPPPQPSNNSPTAGCGPGPDRRVGRRAGDAGRQRQQRSGRRSVAISLESIQWRARSAVVPEHSQSHLYGSRGADD